MQMLCKCWMNVVFMMSGYGACVKGMFVVSMSMSVLFIIENIAAVP